MAPGAGGSRAAHDQDAASLVDRALARATDPASWDGAGLRQLAEVKAILSAPDDVRRACVIELGRATVALGTRSPLAQRILKLAAGKRLAFAAGEVEALLAPLVRDSTWSQPRTELRVWQASSVLSIVIDRILDSAATWSQADRARLAPLLGAVADSGLGERNATLLRALAAGAAIRFDPIAPGDDFGPRARAVLAAAGEDGRVLGELVELLLGLPASGRPSQRWATAADAVRARMRDPGALVGALLDALLAAGDTERTWQAGDQTLTRVYFVDANEPFAVAIAVFAGRAGDAGLLTRLRRLAIKSVTIVGGQFGAPRSLKLANACARAMAEIAAPSSITELLALERAVRHGTLRKTIRLAIDELAAARSMTRQELLELAVETHDLDADGQLDVALGEATARIVTDGATATLVYVDEHGRSRMSVPRAVKDAHGFTLAALRAELKSIRTTIAGERHRLEELMALDVRWPLERWRAHYLGHPITGALARRLIWTFRSPDDSEIHGIPLDDGTVVDAAGRSAAIAPQAQVRLWHPIHAPRETVRAWRQRLLDEEMAQPFKQAFRETYALTPAEAETATYSNRFAGHIFVQSQARALLSSRGWSPVALAAWDDGIDHGVARRGYEPFGLRAEFHFDPIGEFGADTGGLYPYCTSDQVGFVDATDDDAVALEAVPAVVFSEAMRDVDLVIGVSSIGADPNWLDRGEGRQFDRYWLDVGFGELGELARTRRDVLAQLLPRLAIADRCELQERLLLVRGRLRTYRIHLGSSNVQMSPDDRYLCIVGTRDRRVEKLFVPFDDDLVLSLILSKAFLLADDDAITDPSIVAQLTAR